MYKMLPDKLNAHLASDRLGPRAMGLLDRILGLLPGPMSAIISGTGLSSWSKEFPLATQNLVLCIIGYATPGTILTVSHEGEPLLPVGAPVWGAGDAAGKFTAWFAANGLTPEAGSVTITALGGTFGPAMVECNDDFGAGAIVAELVGTQIGLGGTTLPLVNADAQGGWLLHSWLAQGGSPAAVAQPPEDNLIRVSGQVAGGAVTWVASGWSIGTGWVQDGSDYVHSGIANTSIAKGITPNQNGPLGYNLDCQIADGARVTLSWRTTTSALTQRSYEGPFDGVINDFISGVSAFSMITVSARGDVRLRGLEVIQNPATFWGSIGRQIAPAFNGAQVVYSRAYSSDYLVSAVRVVPAADGGGDLLP